MEKWTTQDWELYYSLKENAMETIGKAMMEY